MEKHPLSTSNKTKNIEIQNEYKRFNKLIDEETKIYENMKGCPFSMFYDYYKKFNDINEEVNKKLGYINSILEEIRNKNENKRLPQYFENIFNNIFSKKRDIELLKKNISELEQERKKKESQEIEIQRKKSNNSFLNLNISAGSSSSINNSMFDSKDEALIQDNEYIGTNLLKSRTKVLAESAVVAGQLRELSESAKVNVYSQGKMLGKLEEHVIEIDTNTKKAKNEIKEVNEAHKTTYAKNILMVGLILILILVILFLLKKLVQ